MKRRISILAIVGAGLAARRAMAATALGRTPATTAAKPQAAPRFWRATIHHTDTSPANPAARVRNIDADHRTRGWDGIGYHLLVAEDGGVWFGRPLDRQGAHVLNENEGNLGIALIGNYSAGPPPAAVLASVRRLLAWAFETWGFGPEAVYFHKELAATECPGNWAKEVLLGPLRIADFGPKGSYEGTGRLRIERQKEARG